MNLVLFPPASDWLPPAKFPNLKHVREMGVDIETCDPSLHTAGPGGIRGEGHVAGVSLSDGDKSWYFPVRHAHGGNMKNVDATWKFLHDTLNVERTYVGANLQYELEWLGQQHDIALPGDLVDVQIVEALIDEEQDSYDLDALSNKYLKRGKDESLLRLAAKEFGIDPKRDLHKLHSKYVGPYGEFDAMAPLLIWRAQQEQIREQGLQQILDLELPITRLLWLMRRQGIGIDLEAAGELSATLLKKEEALRYDIWKNHGCKIDEWSGDMLASVCDRLKIIYHRTPKGNPSFEGEWLENHDHPFLKGVSSLRELNRLRDTFVDKWIFGHVHRGKIHPQWKQLKSDDGGTRTGRLAASNPNPQQVPSRSEIAPLIRKLFVPLCKSLKWCKLDYSQQEPRILVHFAYLCKMTGADLVRMAYRDNKSMDIYQFLADSASVTRREAKDITLGRFYGMGHRKLAAKLGISEELAKKKLEEFDRSVPFVKEISERCAQLASNRGHIKTICGRRRHFNWWEPARAYQMRQENPRADVRPRKLAEAQEKWHKMNLVRANTHKALNSLIQGSAADMTKAAMLMIWRETGQIPYMQVHDELNYGVDRDTNEGVSLQQRAENPFPMEVPIKADMSLEEHWK